MSLLAVYELRGEALAEGLKAIGHFFIWLVSGHVCPQCGVERTGKHWRTRWAGGDEFRENHCATCQAANLKEYWARREAREREDRIEEMAEAIRRSCPAAKKRARRGRKS